MAARRPQGGAMRGDGKVGLGGAPQSFATLACALLQQNTQAVQVRAQDRERYRTFKAALTAIADPRQAMTFEGVDRRFHRRMLPPCRLKCIGRFVRPGRLVTFALDGQRHLCQMVEQVALIRRTVKATVETALRQARMIRRGGFHHRHGRGHVAPRPLQLPGQHEPARLLQDRQRHPQFHRPLVYI